MSKTQLSFFDTSALGGGSNTLFWGDLPGDRALDEAASLAKEAAAAPVVAPRCLVPLFDGVLFSREWKEALWDRYVMGAPRLRTPCEQ
ncbi:hypothetical protein, partial [Gluconobacter oxydans]